MGFSYHKTKDDYFITINGKPFTDFNPSDVAALINGLPKHEKTFVKEIIKQKPQQMYEEMTGQELPDDYAKAYGRPSLTEVPFMRSENDGYPYLPGHNPMCNGKHYYGGMCECQYDRWNTPEVRGDYMVWPGGPDMDDFDM